MVFDFVYIDNTYICIYVHTYIYKYTYISNIYNNI